MKIKKAILNTTKNVIEKGKWYAYHFEHKKEAIKTLKIIEANKGKLNTKDKILCKEYAKDIFGAEKYAPWLFVYCAYAKEFKEGWIPDNYFGEFVVPQLNGEYGKICDRNAIIRNLLEESEPLDICYYINNLCLNTNYEVLNEAEIKKILFNNNQKVVYKLENSRQGKGIFIFDENNFSLNVIKKIGNGVFQYYIEQHPFFIQFNKSAVATIRVTTVCDDKGNIQVKSGFFKFGRESDTHVKSDSAIYIPIKIEDGTLFETAFHHDCQPTNRLPDNDFPFASKVLPSYDECIAEVIKMHHRIPFVRCVGWDIIVDKNNTVRLIEVNGVHPGIWFQEMIDGPCFIGLNWESLRNKN